MKKLIVLFLGSCSLMACATWQQQQQPAFDWRGQNFDDYVLKYGVPTSQYVLQSGNVAYSFVEQCTYNPGQAETTVMVDAENMITSISKKGSCMTADEVRRERQYEKYAREREAKQERHAHNNGVSREIESINSQLKYYEIVLRTQESEVKLAESELSLAQTAAKAGYNLNMKGTPSSVREAEENLKKAQAKWNQLNQEKEALEQKKAQLAASYWQ